MNQWATARVCLFSLILLLSPAGVMAQDTPPSCETEGNSTEDRTGCLDTDGDGWSDPDSSWNTSMGADAFPDDETEHRDLDGDGIGDEEDSDMDGDGIDDEVDVWPEDPEIWSDIDGDGYADQSNHQKSDNCPYIYGKSRIRLKGCSDIDGDFMPDEYDDDADGDGIRNEMERSASSGTILYDPFNAESTPLDTDQDTIPDVLDHDNDNDGWPDEVELDRGSDIYDDEETPFTLYFGIGTGIFYAGGLNADSFSLEYNADSMEFSVSGVMEIVFEELVIPLLLIPVYLGIFFSRRNEFLRCLDRIENAMTISELHEIEKVVNSHVKEKRIKVYHGLVLRNALEEAESDCRNPSGNSRWLQEE